MKNYIKNTIKNVRYKMRGTFGKLKFNTNKQFRELAFKTLESYAHMEKFKIPYTDKKSDDAGFILVKDHGIYLIPAYKHEGTPRDIGLVIYASGYNPKYNDSMNLWEKAHDYSADDFGEFIPMEIDMLIQLIYGGTLTVNLTEDTISTECIINKKDKKEPSSLRKYLIMNFYKVLNERKKGVVNG